MVQPVLTPRCKPAQSAPAAFLPRAKNVIFMAGPSYLDLFDPKPEMRKWHGQRVPESLLAGLQDPLIKGSHGHGQSANISATGRAGWNFRLPHPARWRMNCASFARCTTRAITTRAIAPEFRHTVARQSQHVIRIWTGSPCADLPGYVVLMSTWQRRGRRTALWSNGFLSSAYRGVTFRHEGEPILHLSNPRGMSAATQRARLDVLGDLNQLRQQTTGDAEIGSRIAAYELAFRMQSAAPELLDFSKESPATRTMYGLDREATRAFGSNCLLARRMIERGVRFVQLFHSTWDDHYDLNKTSGSTEMTDQPTAAPPRSAAARLARRHARGLGGEFAARL